MHLPPLNSPTLTILDLSNNHITDLSALLYLDTLHTLHLANNQITDLSPLLNLPSLKTLEIWNNPLSPVSLNGHISTLQEAGVTVYHK